MPVVINEVIVRAIITGDNNDRQGTSAPSDIPETVSSITKSELIELVDEVINDKKER